MQYHLCDTESRVVIQDFLKSLKHLSTWYDFVQVPHDVAALVKDDSFGKVCIQAFRPDGWYRPGAMFTKKELMDNPRLRSLWTFSIILKAGPPFVKLLKSEHEGRILSCFFGFPTCMIAERGTTGDFLLFNSAFQYVIEGHEPVPKAKAEMGLMRLSFPLMAVNSAPTPALFQLHVW